jgi:hypothetical protein
MKRSAAFLLVFSLSIGTFSLVAQPKLVIMDGGEKFDLDSLMAGVVAERTIGLKNAGNEPLKIDKVDASCGCTGTMISTDNLKPGESGALKITFNSKNFSGKVHKTVTINSNDPASPRTKIEFSAIVTEEVAVSENRFLFKEAVVGERRTATATITNNSKKQLELKGYHTTLEGFTLKFPSLIKPGETAQVVAEFVPKQVKKVLNSNVAIETNNELKPEIQFSVVGSVKEWKFE